VHPALTRNASIRTAVGPRPTRPPRAIPAVLSLVLIGHHRLLREALAAMIHSRPGFEVLTTSAAVREALQQMRQARPEIVLVDFGIEDHDSLRLIATICTEVPGARVIVTSFRPNQDNVVDFVRVGACGFIMKDASVEDFFQCIRSVAAGNEVLPPTLTKSLFVQTDRDDSGSKGRILLDEVRLTGREQQVIDLLAAGRSNKAIAKQLHIAIHTVKSHVHNVLEKLALRSRLEVAAFTHARGWPRRSVREAWGG
jgi:DNA-binding NarL/FixJ family response regulator